MTKLCEYLISALMRIDVAALIAYKKEKEEKEKRGKKCYAHGWFHEYKSRFDKQ